LYPFAQALVDPQPSVVADAIMSLAGIAAHLRKRSLLAAAAKVMPLLHHRHAAVRQAALTFAASVRS
jgi:hypothetical protein